MISGSNGHCQALVDRLLSLLLQGLAADQTVTDFVATTFDCQSLGQLQKILADETNEDRDALADLLLFPDDRFQLALEPFLGTHDFSSPDEARVSGGLAANIPVVPVEFPVWQGCVAVPLATSAAERFVRRLHICWRPDPSLRQAIERCAGLDRKTMLYIRLRNTGLPCGSAGSRLLCRFLDAFDVGQPDFTDCFGFIVELASRTGAGESGYEQLMTEKRRWVTAAQSALALEKMRATDNLETLMLRGIRIPVEGAADAVRRIDMIDRLARTLYGQTGT